MASMPSIQEEIQKALGEYKARVLKVALAAKEEEEWCDEGFEEAMKALDIGIDNVIDKHDNGTIIFNCYSPTTPPHIFWYKNKFGVWYEVNAAYCKIHITEYEKIRENLIDVVVVKRIVEEV